MSDVGGTCEYALDPEDPATWGGKDGDECYVHGEHLNDDGMWTCPHDAESGDRLCLFHQPVVEKDDEAVTAKMIQILEEISQGGENTANKRRSQFIGGRFGTIEVREDVTCPCQIDLRHSTIEWFDLSKPEFDDEPTVIDVDINLAGSECDVLSTGGGSWAYGATFRGGFDCRGMVSERFSSTLGDFRGPMDFANATFGETVSFSDTFRDEVDFQSVTIKGSLSLRAAFGETVDFRDATIGGEVYAQGGVGVAGDFRFDSVEVGGDVSFGGLSVERTGSFRGASIRGSADFRNADFGSADFSDTYVGQDANFCDVDFGENVDFTRAVIEGERRFDRAEVAGESFGY